MCIAGTRPRPADAHGHPQCAQISASPQRIATLEGACDAGAQNISMRLVGAPAEVVSLSLLTPARGAQSPSGDQLVGLDVTIGSDGSARAECTFTVGCGRTGQCGRCAQV